MSSSKKFTKHKKKYWRKGIDTKDIEESITEQRRQKLLHDLASNKKNDELFEIEGTPTYSQNKRRPLTSEYHCTNHSIITLPIHHNKMTTSDAMSSSEDEIDMPREEMCSYRNVTLAKNVKCRGLGSLRKNLIETKPIDIWSTEATINDKPLPQRPAGIKRNNIINNNSIANLELPHSGTSYNPLYTDHQNLLHRATKDEERKLEKYKKLCSSIKMTPMDHNDRERQWLIEATEGLENKEEEEKEEGEGSDENEVAVPKFVAKRKTRQQKRKEMAQKQLALVRKASKLERQRQSDFNRIKSMKKEIAARERSRLENLQRRALRKSLYKTLRIGKYKYEKPPIDVQLSSELCGSLRLLQGTGSSLMSDRFMSLQKRNMVVPKGPHCTVRKSTIKKR